MKALLYYGPKDIRLEDINRPIAKADDVIVKVMRAGICGSDLKAYLYDGHSVGILWKDEFPGIDGQFGHEMVGVVDEVGANVTNVHVGDRVFVNPTNCRRAGMMTCDMSGAFSEYVLVEDAAYGYNLLQLSESTSFDEAVLTEPLAVATHGKNQIEVKPHEHVVIYGAGTIGLCSLEACLAIGCKQPVVIDLNDDRLALAEELGGIGFNPTKGETKAFLTEHFGCITNPFGGSSVDVDAYLDCAGGGIILDDVIKMAKPQARIAIVAVYKQPVSVDMALINSSELTIRGSLGYAASDVLEAYNNIDQHRNHVSKLVTHQFAHADSVRAFKVAADPRAGSVKVVINYEL